MSGRQDLDKDLIGRAIHDHPQDKVDFRKHMEGLTWGEEAKESRIDKAIKDTELKLKDAERRRQLDIMEVDTLTSVLDSMKNIRDGNV